MPGREIEQLFIPSSPLPVAPRPKWDDEQIQDWVRETIGLANAAARQALVADESKATCLDVRLQIIRQHFELAKDAIPGHLHEPLTRMLEDTPQRS